MPKFRLSTRPRLTKPRLSIRSVRPAVSKASGRRFFFSSPISSQSAERVTDDDALQKDLHLRHESGVLGIKRDSGQKPRVGIVDVTQGHGDCRIVELLGNRRGAGPDTQW